MLISYSHDFLFTHIPKTGGTSVRNALQRFAYSSEGVLVNRLLARVGINVNVVIGPHTWKRFRGHSSLATAQRALPRALFERLFKFAFVRNPWDYVVSYYHFLLGRPPHRHYSTIKRLPGFPSFVRWCIRHGVNMQWRMIAGRDGGLLTDFIGRFETIHDDFAVICDRLGIKGVGLPHRNASRRNDYRSYYDDATAELVGEHWRKDVEGFGYTFDGVASAVQPLKAAA